MIDPETIIDGRYRVLSRLGSGGMADVYLAEDQLLGRRVAVKVLHPHFAADQEFVERFKREASSAAALSHPNIVGIFDRGEWDGTYYIAMECVAGRSLKELVRESGPLEPAHAIDVVVQILRAARSAHRRGVIHRDLKPHNVIIDEEGRARVTDFGIARAGASDMTMTGSIMGTAQYLSPEQAQGFAVTAASDLYSVGVILYELLTGAVPFEGESAVAIAFQQVSAAPRPPSELNPAVSPSLDAIVLRALAKDPASRYADDDELIAALERERAALPALTGVAHAAAPGPPPTLLPVPAPVLMAPALAPEDPAADRRRALLWGVAIALLLAAGLAAALLLSSGSSQLSVPDVGLQSEQQAIATLRRSGLTASVGRANSAKVPAGYVATQAPAPGSRVGKGASVQIVVSAGPGKVAVSGVVGLPEQQARSRLQAAGFVVAPRSQASSSVEAGKVIATEPGAGAEAPRGSRVTMVVSSGPAAVRVPNVVGQTRSAAEGTLENAGFAVGAVSQRVSGAQPPGTVLAQTPAGGADAHPGDKIALVIAQASDQATVPSVTGKSATAAAVAVGAAGLTATTTPAQTSEQSQVGIVLSQHPAAGTHVRKGSAVSLGVGTLAPNTTTTTTPAPTTSAPVTPPAPAPAG